MPVATGSITTQNSSMGVPVMVWQGSTAAAVIDKVFQQQSGSPNAPFDLTPYTSLKFFMRTIDSAAIVVNGGAASLLGQAAQGQIQYTPLAADVTTEGAFKAWWRLQTSGGSYVETAEFDLWVVQHHQGLGTPIGLIARRAGAIMPSSWQKLRQMPAVGDWELQNKIEALKHRYLSPAVYVSAANEISLDPVAIDYLAKRAVQEALPTAIDYWLDQRIGATTPQEHSMYGSRIDALKELAQILDSQLDDLFDEFVSIVGPYTRRKAFSPASDTENLPLITVDPMGMPSSFGPSLPRVLTSDYFFPQFRLPFVNGVGP